MMQPSDEGEIRLVVMWQDWSIDSGRDATDILRDLCGGFNPETLPALRRALAQRAGIPAPSRSESDRDFLDRLAQRGVLMIYEVHPEEWSFAS